MPRDFTVIDAPQRSAAWKQARCGRLTGSRAKDMLATVKSGEAAARRDLRVQLAVERLTGEPQDSDFVNADMQRGIDLEADAFAAYEATTGLVADRCGFVASTQHQAGCSPDAVIGDFEGLVELKVPRAATHFNYLRGQRTVPPDHVPQLVHALWVTGADYVDFLSYDPRFHDPSLQTFFVRLERDAAMLLAYEKKALAFLDEVERDLQVMATLQDPVRQLARAVAR